MRASLSISISDLIKTIIKKWYVLAICVAVCALAMLLYGKNLESKVNDVIVASPLEAVTDEDLEYINKIIEMEKVELEMRNSVEPSDLEGYEEYKEYKDAVSKMKGEFTVKQSQAYDVISNKETAVTTTEQQQVPIKKYVVIGIILGILAGCGLVTLAYMFSTRLRTANDIREAFGIPNLKDEEMLKTILKRRNISKVAIIGCASGDIKDIETTDLQSADAAVFAEKIGVSRYKDIQSDYEECTLFQIPVIGYLIK